MKLEYDRAYADFSDKTAAGGAGEDLKTLGEALQTKRDELRGYLEDVVRRGLLRQLGIVAQLAFIVDRADTQRAHLTAEIEIRKAAAEGRSIPPVNEDQVSALESALNLAASELSADDELAFRVARKLQGK